MRRAYPRWRLLAGLVALALTVLAVLGAPATALNTYPQVNSKTLQSGKDVLEWGNRYQVNVCDSHHAWSSMTLWVRASAKAAWQKVGRTTKVSDTRSWPRPPARCRWFAPFEWTVDLPDRGFGTIQFGYGSTRPEHLFRAVVRNDSDPTSSAPSQSPPDPGPAPTPSRQPSPPTGTVVSHAYLWDLGTTSSALRYGKDVRLSACMPDYSTKPLLYARSGTGAWAMVSRGTLINNPGTVCDARGGYDVLWNWTVNVKGSLDARRFPYPLVALGTAYRADGSVPAVPDDIVVNAIVFPDKDACTAAGYSGC